MSIIFLKSYFKANTLKDFDVNIISINYYVLIIIFHTP